MGDSSGRVLMLGVRSGKWCGGKRVGVVGCLYLWKMGRGCGSKLRGGRMLLLFVWYLRERVGW